MSIPPVPLIESSPRRSGGGHDSKDKSRCVSDKGVLGPHRGLNLPVTGRSLGDGPTSVRQCRPRQSSSLLLLTQKFLRDTGHDYQLPAHESRAVVGTEDPPRPTLSNKTTQCRSTPTRSTRGRLLAARRDYTRVEKLDGTSPQGGPGSSRSYTPDLDRVYTVARDQERSRADPEVVTHNRR